MNNVDSILRVSEALYGSANEIESLTRFILNDKDRS